MRRTTVSEIQGFVDALQAKLPRDYTVRASPIFGQEWMVFIESASQTDTYHVDMEHKTWVRYVSAA